MCFTWGTQVAALAINVSLSITTTCSVLYNPNTQQTRNCQGKAEMNHCDQCSAHAFRLLSCLLADVSVRCEWLARNIACDMYDMYKGSGSERPLSTFGSPW